MMTTTTRGEFTDHPFWRFSIQLGQPTQNRLQELAQRYGWNTHIVLFCLWFATHNQGLLAKTDIKKLLTAIHTWHERIVLPLQTMRHDITKPGLPSWSGSIRQEIGATEIAAENIETFLLLQAQPAKLARRRSRTSAQKAADGWQNILTYCQIIFVQLNAHDCLTFAEILPQIFPELTLFEAQAICCPDSHPPGLGMSQKQLPLAL